jgi:glycogen operon protein
MLRTTKRVIRLRKEFMAAQPRDYPTRDDQGYLHWFDEHGAPMSAERWNDPRHRVVQLLLGSEDGQLDGLMVINGSKDDVKIILPDVINAEDTEKRLFELRLTTSALHDRRQGMLVAAGERDVIQAHTISIYRT